MPEFFSEELENILYFVKHHACIYQDFMMNKKQSERESVSTVMVEDDVIVSNHLIHQQLNIMHQRLETCDETSLN